MSNAPPNEEHGASLHLSVPSITDASWSPLPGSPVATAAASTRRLPRGHLYAVSFWGGFQIMVLEIAGLRVLQTNLGSSVVVTGTLLALVMTVLAGGYSLGGWLSTKLHDPLLFAVLTLGGLYAQFASLGLIEPTGTLSLHLWEALEGQPYLRSALPAALLTIVLCGPPMLAMSTISPYWIRLSTVGASAQSGAADVGQQSGLFMSLSTVGSIAGTALSSYVLLPMFGVEVSTAATNTVFLVLVIGGWFSCARQTRQQRLLPAIAALVVVVGSVAAWRLGRAATDPQVIYNAESMYGQMRVLDTRDEAGRRLLRYEPSRLYTHSVLYPDDPLRELEAVMYLAPGLLQKPKDILVLGSAAGGILRKIEVAFPDVEVTGVDLDPEAHVLARGIFGVNTAQSELLTADARLHLVDDTRSYDLIMVDLFSGEFIPTHCITREFFELVRSRLRPGGTLFINTNMTDVPYEVPEGSEPFRAIRHLESTLAAAGFPTLFENTFFHSLFAFPSPTAISSFRSGLTASLHDASLAPALRAGAGLAAYTTVEVPRRSAYRPFTDRWAPAPSIELKSNDASIYAALAEAVEVSPATTTPAGTSPIASLVLRQRLQERAQHGEASLRDLGSLYTALNTITAPVTPADLDQASLVFRYSWDIQDGDVTPATPWARLAAFYVQLYRRGWNGDREALLPILLDPAAPLQPPTTH